MDKPSDRPSGENSYPDHEYDPIPKVGMFNPGFREIEGDLATQYKASVHKPSPNRLDQKNKRFILLAILIILMLFALLEYKQICDATLDQNQAQTQLKPTSLFR